MENKFDTSDLFTNRKNHQGKTPLSEFKVITPKNLLLSKQVVTNKGISVPYTNLQLNPYPNQACPRVDPGRVCAQPGTDPTRSVSQKFNSPPTGMVDQIGRIGPSTDDSQFGRSWRYENRPKFDDLTVIFQPDFLRISRNLIKFEEISPDLVRSRQIQ